MENRKEEKVTLFPRRLFLRLAALALAAVLVLGLTACDSLPDSGGHTVKPSTGSSQPFEMHFIDVGQALSVLVECDGQFMLYDGGNVDDGSLVAPDRLLPCRSCVLRRGLKGRRSRRASRKTGNPC